MSHSLNMASVRLDSRFLRQVSRHGGTMDEFLKGAWLPQQECYKPLDVLRAITAYNRNRKDLIVSALIQLNDGEMIGIELVRRSDGALAVTLPEPSSRGGVRVSYYNDHGPINHDVFGSGLEAIEAAITNGYQDFCPGRLDTLTELRSWAIGIEYLALRAKYPTDWNRLAEFSPSQQSA